MRSIRIFSLIKWFAAMMIMCLIMMLSSCAEKEVQTIESFMATNPDVASEIDAKLSEIKFEGTSISIDYEADLCIITLRYNDTFDKSKVEKLKKSFDENSESIDRPSIDMIDTIVKGTDFQNPSLTIKIINGDDKEIWSKDYSTSKMKKTQN